MPRKEAEASLLGQTVDRTEMSDRQLEEMERDAEIEKQIHDRPLAHKKPSRVIDNDKELTRILDVSNSYILIYIDIFRSLYKLYVTPLVVDRYLKTFINSSTRMKTIPNMERPT
jgi:hypothetical protein